MELLGLCQGLIFIPVLSGLEIIYVRNSPLMLANYVIGASYESGGTITQISYIALLLVDWAWQIFAVCGCIYTAALFLLPLLGITIAVQPLR